MDTDSTGALAVIPEAVLYAKMARVMGIINRVPKEGYNTFHKYKYAKADDVADAIREAMAEANLALIPRMGEVRQETYEYIAEGKPKTTIRTTIKFDFIFACGDTGAVIVSPWVGQVDDNSDKAINKCATSAEKYFLMKTFIVSAGNEPDADADKHREEAESKVTPPPEPSEPLLKWHEKPGALTDLAEKAFGKPNQWITECGVEGVKQLVMIIWPKTWDDFADRAAAGLYIKQVVEDTQAELARAKAQPPASKTAPAQATPVTNNSPADADLPLTPEPEQDEPPPAANSAPAPLPDIPADDVRKLLNGDHKRPDNGNGKTPPADTFKLKTGGASPFAPEITLDADAARIAAKELAGD